MHLSTTPGTFSDGHALKQWRRVRSLTSFGIDGKRNFFHACKVETNGLHPVLLSESESKTRNIAVGDVVVLSCDDVHRYHWPLGKVVKCITDSSGIVRSVDVKTAKSLFRRPTTRCVLLVPIEEQ